MVISLTIYCLGGPNPIWAMFGFILMIVIITLSIREKLRKTKFSSKNKVDEQVKSPYVEKDVLGFDKSYTNHNEPSYKPADKSKFKFIIFIAVFLIGFFLMVAYSPIKYGAYKGSVGPGYIHHPEDQSQDYFFGRFYWDFGYQDLRDDDSTFPDLVFEEKYIFEEVDSTDGIISE